MTDNNKKDYFKLQEEIENLIVNHYELFFSKNMKKHVVWGIDTSKLNPAVAEYISERLKTINFYCKNLIEKSTQADKKQKYKNYVPEENKFRDKEQYVKMLEGLPITVSVFSYKERNKIYDSINWVDTLPVNLSDYLKNDIDI